MREEAGFLNTNASLLADLNLLAYVLILVPLMVVGFMYARRKMYEPHHKYIMTTITLFNWVLIVFVMAASFAESVSPQLPDGLSEDFVLFPTIHLVTGGLAQLLATYLVIRMWFENSLPDSLKIKNIKIYMRVTLTLWIVTAALGIITYLVWYTPSEADASDIPAPAVTEEAEPTSELDDPVATEETSDETPEPVTTEEAEPTAEPDDPIATEEVSVEDETPEPVTTEEAEPDDPVATEEAND